MAVCVFLAGKYLLPCLLPFLFGGVLAMTLRPAALRLSRAVRLPRKLAAFLVMTAFFLLAGALFWWLGALFLAQVSAFVARLPALYEADIRPAADALAGRMSALLGSPEGRSLSGALNSAGQYLEQLFSAAASALLSAMGNLVGRLPSVLLALSFSVLSAYFMIMDYEGICRFLNERLPPRLRMTVKDFKDFALNTCRRVIKAYLLIMLITFAEVSVGLWLLRVDVFLVVGLLIAVLDILPVLGSGTVLIPWGVYSLLSGRTALGVGLLVLYGTVTLVRTLIEPKILGGQIGLCPLATIISMYAGLRLWGVGGMILAPMAATILAHLARNGRLHFSG